MRAALEALVVVWPLFLVTLAVTVKPRLVRCMLCGLRWDITKHKACPNCEPKPKEK